jgi:two-component system KDP operon response regulator KdpE
MADKPLVLAVDDEPGVLRLIKLELEAQGLAVASAETGGEAVRAIQEQAPDIIVLDVMLPDINGLELMGRIREYARVPIILLTARNRDLDKVQGLNMGADDYLGKPFSPEELTARVRAVLRRFQRGRAQKGTLRSGEVEIDLERRLVYRRDEMVNLTRTEWLLLEQLAARPGKLVLNGDLLSQVWGPDYRSDLQYLRVWISRLRKKLEDNTELPRLIRTVQGVGYMLAIDEPEQQQNGAA